MNVLPTYGDRPAVVKKDGWDVFVAIHDAAYVSEAKAWKRRLSTAHPDSGGDGSDFRREKSRYERWKRDEEHWYRAHGLMPPTWGTRGQSDVHVCGHRTQTHVLNQLKRGGQQSTADILSALGWPATAANKLRIAIHRLRLRGAQIVVVSDRHKPKLYLLVSDSQYTRPYEGAAPDRVRVALSDGQWHPSTELSTAAGIAPRLLTAAVQRAKRYGAPIETQYQSTRSGRIACYRLQTKGVQAA